MRQSYLRIIPSLLFALFLGMSGAAKVAAADPTDAVTPLLKEADAATKAAAATDAQIVAENTAADAAKAASTAERQGLTAAYKQACPQGFPPERQAQCDQIYQTYSSNFDAAKARYDADYAAYSQRWNVLDAQRKRQRATAETQRAAAQRTLSVVVKSFPNCSLGDGSISALESAVDCMRRAWDGGGAHAPLTVDGGGTPFFWNDKNPVVKGRHDQYAAYAKAQSADDALLQTLKSQIPRPDVRIAALKQSMADRENAMNCLKVPDCIPPKNKP